MASGTTSTDPLGGTEKVLYEVAGGIATITLNDPDTRNALSPELLGGLIEGFQAPARRARALRRARLLA